MYALSANRVCKECGELYNVKVAQASFCRTNTQCSKVGALQDVLVLEFLVMYGNRITTDATCNKKKLNLHPIYSVGETGPTYQSYSLLIPSSNRFLAVLNKGFIHFA
jgi:hypothetical protein